GAAYFHDSAEILRYRCKQFVRKYRKVISRWQTLRRRELRCAVDIHQPDGEVGRRVESIRDRKTGSSTGVIYKQSGQGRSRCRWNTRFRNNATVNFVLKNRSAGRSVVIRVGNDLCPS